MAKHLRFSRTFLWALTAAGVALYLYSLSFGTIARSDMTRTNMMITQGKINSFLMKYHHFPNDLNDLQSTRIKRINDGWGRKLIYRLSEENRLISLGSLGKDGLEGGMGLDSDIWLTFPILLEDGMPPQLGDPIER